MDMFFTTPAVLGLIIYVVAFVYFARSLPLGALSLPCVTILTSFLYFYFMPVASVMMGANSFFGTTLTSLEAAHWLTLLYVLGAMLACMLNERRLRAGAASCNEPGMPLNRIVLIGLWMLFGLSILVQIAFKELNFGHSRDQYFASESLGDISSFKFINFGLTIAEPLTLIYLIRNNFGLKSLAVLAAVLYVFSVAGFRFRVLILLCAAVIAFALVRRVKIRISYVIAGALVALALMNLMGMVRRYGSGLHFGELGDLSIGEALTQFGGEISIVYVTQHAAAHPPDWIWFDPYIVAVTRFIPSFIWHDKPTADYLVYFSRAFAESHAALRAGMAAPQQVEMIYQFGWFGVLPLAFLYFWIVTRLNSGVARLSRETKIAGLALIPPFFGYYMQSRGYFFQMSAEGVFTFLPLFVLSWCSRSPARLPHRIMPPLWRPGGVQRKHTRVGGFSRSSVFRTSSVAEGEPRPARKSPQPNEATQRSGPDHPTETPGTLQGQHRDV